MNANGVFINGKKLSGNTSHRIRDLRIRMEYKIPQDGVFVVPGDHRGLSRNSRDFGIVHAAGIKEKVLF